jgi:hypothetical protein
MGHEPPQIRAQIEDIESRVDSREGRGFCRKVQARGIEERRSVRRIHRDKPCSRLKSASPSPTTETARSTFPAKSGGSRTEVTSV